MLIYVAGPYRGDVQNNIAAARERSIRLWEEGHTVICPHMNSAHFEDVCENISDEEWLQRCINLLARCDAIALVEGWEKSVGTKLEVDYAKKYGIPIIFPGQIPLLHPVEVKSPMQVEGFIEIVMQMYRVHLSKNSDYSPANILGTGEVGLVTRLWDKIARLMNLMGFKIDVQMSSFTQPEAPKHESIDDTLLDAANYSVIGLLLRRGQWGR